MPFKIFCCISGLSTLSAHSFRETAWAVDAARSVKQSRERRLIINAIVSCQAFEEFGGKPPFQLSRTSVDQTIRRQFAKPAFFKIQCERHLRSDQNGN